MGNRLAWLLDRHCNCGVDCFYVTVKWKKGDEEAHTKTGIGLTDC